MVEARRTTKAHAANRERGQRTRDKILAAAIDVAGKVGPARTTLAKVAREAGVSNGTVHYHFRSMGDLLIGALRDRDLELTERLTPLIEVGGLEGLRTLPVVGEYAVEKPESSRLHALLLADAIDPDHFAHRWFRRRQPLMIAMFEKAVELGQERGELRAAADAKRVAGSILAFMDGVTLRFALDPTTEVVAEYEAFFAMLLEWLAVREAPRRS